MTIAPPNFYPPFNILRLSHVELGVTDLQASRAFYEGILGLRVSAADDEALYLRGMEERVHHSLILRKTPQPVALSLGFKVFADADLDRAAEWFASKGLPVEWVTRSQCQRCLRTQDPFGVPLEFYATMQRLPPAHQEFAAYRGVRPLRIDHCNVFCPDVDAAYAFYNEMGFRLTEYTQDDESGRFWAVWMHRKGGVHDIAFTNGRGPRLHHLAYWVSNPLVIIDLLDLMATSGYLANIERGPGRHGISNAFFLYVLDPDGHRIETYCSDYQTVDPDLEPIRWDLKDPRRQTLWGAPAPRSWFEQGVPFEGVTPVDPVLAGQPIVAP